MIAQTLTNPFLDLLARCGFVDVAARNDEGRYYFAVSLVWNTHDRDIQHLGVGEQAVLDFQGMNVLAATDD